MLKRDRMSEMVLAYYGELSDAERQRFEHRLATDPDFAAAYGRLCTLLDAVAEHKPALEGPAATAEFWTALEYNICRRIRQEAERKRWWERRWQLRPWRVAIAVAGIAAAFLMGAIVGMQMRTLQPGQQSSFTSTTPQPSAVPATAAVVPADDYIRNFLRRSQLYIATAADRQLQCARCVPIEKQIDHRQLAQELLQEANRLRRLAPNDPRVKKVLQDIEVVVANLSREPRSLSPTQVEMLHNIANLTVCEVAATLDSDNNQRSHSP